MFRLSVIGVFERRRNDHTYGVSLSHSRSRTHSRYLRISFAYAFAVYTLFSLNICICSQLKTHILIAVILVVFIHALHIQALAHSLALSHSPSLRWLARSRSLNVYLLPLPACLSVSRSIGLPFKYYAELGISFFDHIHICTVYTIWPYS